MKPMTMRVAYQGEVGAFSEEAALALYPEAEPVALPTFDAVFAAVAAGASDRAVIPIENSLFGSVHVNYDLLRENDLTIVRELNLRIRHHLMAARGVDFEDVQAVLSHPQALGQCRRYLREHMPDVREVPVYDTAGAAKMVAEAKAPDQAAIASEKAAAEYDLNILAAGIESNQRNFTRFLALSPDGEERAERADSEVPEAGGAAVRHKTSLVYSMHQNVPGALFKSLAVFALRDLDLFKIESRPLVGSPGSYLFYLDVEGRLDDEPVRNALDHLNEIAVYLKVLGSYPAAPPIHLATS